MKSTGHNTIATLSAHLSKFIWDLNREKETEKRDKTTSIVFYLWPKRDFYANLCDHLQNLSSGLSSCLLNSFSWYHLTHLMTHIWIVEWHTSGRNAKKKNKKNLNISPVSCMFCLLSEINISLWPVTKWSFITKAIKFAYLFSALSRTTNDLKPVGDLFHWLSLYPNQFATPKKKPTNTTTTTYSEHEEFIQRQNRLNAHN